MVRAGRLSWTLATWLILQTACASSAAPEPAPSLRALTARRVIDILEQRHLTHQRLDDRLSARVFDALLRALDPATGCAAQRARLQAQRLRLDDALRAADVAPARDASRACTGRDRPSAEAEALLLDALARAYDPHSAFLAPSQLAAWRAQIHAPPSPEREARGRLVEHGGTRIAWIVLPSFYLRPDGRSASRDLGFILRQLTAQGAQVALLDLRGNAGGVIEEGVRLTSLFAGAGIVACELRSDGTTRLLRARGPAEYKGRLVVLVDAGTASVAEVFAGAIQDQARGLVIGRRTHGKGSGQTLVLLSSPTGAPAGAVNVTDRLFYRIDGQPLQRFGVTPDVELALEVAAAPTERERAGALAAAPIAPADAGLRFDAEELRALRERVAPEGKTPEAAASAVAVDYLHARGLR